MLIFQSSSSHEEGGARDSAVLTKQLSGEDGRLKSLHAIIIASPVMDNGELTLKELPGTEFEIPVDLLILALGFIGPQTEELRQQLGAELNAQGNILTDE